MAVSHQRLMETTTAHSEPQSESSDARVPGRLYIQQSLVSQAQSRSQTNTRRLVWELAFTKGVLLEDFCSNAIIFYTYIHVRCVDCAYRVPFVSKFPLLSTFR